MVKAIVTKKYAIEEKPALPPTTNSQTKVGNIIYLQKNTRLDNLQAAR